MALPLTTDYTYTFDRGGLLLELNTDAVVPFWDVHKIEGLDLPDFNAIIDEVDGQHGGLVHTGYANTRTIVAEGVMYADPNQIDVEVLRAGRVMLPDNIVRKWWFRQPGVAARYINTKAIGFKYDIDQGRRIGSMDYQLQWVSEDPIIYRDETSLNLADNVSQVANNAGWVPTFPIITISGDWATANIENVSTGQMMQIQYDTVGAQTVIVDMRSGSVKINGVENNAVASGEWWPLGLGNNTVKVNIIAGSATITFAYASGWMV